MNDDKGTSLVLINSKKGHDLFNKLSNKMIYKEVNIDDAIKYNSSAIYSAKRNINRENFFHKLEDVPFDKLVKKYGGDSIIIKIKIKCKSILKKILLISTLIID